MGVRVLAALLPMLFSMYLSARVMNTWSQELAENFSEGVESMERAPEVAVKWVLGKKGASCTSTCATCSQSSFASVASVAQFHVFVVNTIENMGDAKCADIVAGGLAINPVLDGDGKCYTNAQGSSTCDNSHPTAQRFCPCVGGEVIEEVIPDSIEEVQEVEEAGPSGHAPVLRDGVPELSRQWMEKLDAKDVKELRHNVGEEIYDAECSDYVTEIINSHTGDHAWWLDTFDEDPLVHSLMDKKSSKDIHKKWNDLNNEELQAAPGLKTNSMNWFQKIWHNTWGSMSRWWRSRRAKSERRDNADARRFRQKLEEIKAGDEDDDGKRATICSLDYNTLKLMPFSKGWHKDLQQKDRERHGEKNAKCVSTEAPLERARRKLGYMDVDRVVRATQMAIYQTCYFKCLRFVVRNFEKTVMGRNLEGADFCELPYDQQRAKTGDINNFLFKLISDRESDRYSECSMLFSEDDSGAELLDFAIEEACSVYRRPTPMYFPSESPPLELYQTRTAHNQPVCRPAGIAAKGKHAVQVGPGSGNRSQDEPQRYCTEGTHCLCQRASRVSHVAAPKKTPPKWSGLKINHWFAQDHCSALRPSGRSAFIWIDPVKIALSKWKKDMTDFRITNYGTHIGIAAMFSSAVFFGVSMGAFSSIGLWWTATAGPWFTTVVGPWFAGVGASAAGAATGAASFATAGVGPAVVLGLVGLTFVVRSQTFDCAGKIGCYPLDCSYNHDTKTCGMTMKGVYPDEGPSHAMWWVPPPSMQCSLKSRKWWKFYGASRSCHLKACTPEQMSKNLIGYFVSPHSKSGKKMDFLNCQPLNLKDMSGKQQNEFLKTLNDEVRVSLSGRVRDNKALREYLFKTYKIPMPECLTDANCREGLEGHPEELPFCHLTEKRCREPLISAMSLKLQGVDESQWEEKTKKFLASAIFGQSSKTSEILILEEPVEAEQPGTEVERHDVPLPEGSEVIDDGSESEDLTDVDAAGNPVVVQPESSLVQVGEPGQGLVKNFKLVIKARNSESKEKYWATLKRLEEADNGQSAEELGLKNVLGKDFHVDITGIGSVCEKRARVEHSTKVCSNTRSGFGCPLECEDGWIPRSTITCSIDGTWSDHDVEQGSLVPSQETPVFMCEQVACQPLVLGHEFCPRAVEGCYTWDSQCERGGLSGEQPYCEITPTEGYYLVKPRNNKWKCKTDKQWSQLPDFDETPRIAEWTCQGAAAEAAGLVDKESGVESICDEAKSGKMNKDDTEPGKCKVVCKQGMMVNQKDPLRCGADNKWTGMAKCEPIRCSSQEFPEEAFDRTQVKIVCSQPVGVGEKATEKCEVKCIAGGEVVSNGLYCSAEGKWVDSVSCADLTANKPTLPSKSQQGSRAKKDNGAHGSMSVSPVVGVVVAFGAAAAAI